MAEETPTLGPLDQAYAQLLAEATQGSAARRSDWLVAFDTGLCGRLTACTLCGRRDLVTWGMLSLWQTAMAYVLCARCARPEGVRQVERWCVRRSLATGGASD